MTRPRTAGEEPGTTSRKADRRLAPVAARARALLPIGAVLLSAGGALYDVVTAVPVLRAAYSCFGAALLPLLVALTATAYTVGILALCRRIPRVARELPTVVRLHLPLNLMWLTHLSRDVKNHGFINLLLATVAVLVAIELLRALRGPIPGGRPEIGRRVEWLVVALTCAGLATVYYGHYRKRTHITDRVAFGWDDWNYQQEAVNLATGHGFPVAGGVERFSTYKFQRIHNQSKKAFREAKRRFVHNGRNGGYHTYYRAPGYPLYAGLLYSAFGVSPKLLKLSQLVMLVLIAAGLPLVGYSVRRAPGFICAIPAGHFFLQAHHESAARILTEPLMSFMVLLLIIAWLHYHRRRGHIALAILGAITGLCLLVKGSFVFVPGLTVIYLLSSPPRGRRAIRLIATYSIATALTVGSWSIFVRVQSNEWILISTQGSSVLPEGNNPACVDSGGWCRDGSSYFEEAGLVDRSTGSKVLTFWWRHRGSLPTLLANKLAAAFSGNTSLKLLLLLALAGLLWRGDGARRSRAVNLAILAFTGAAFAAFGRAGASDLMLGLPRNPAALLAAVGTLSAARLISSRLRWRPDTSPVSAILILNFVLLTLVVFGLPRFIAPISFVILFVFFSQAVLFAHRALTLCETLLFGPPSETPASASR